VFGVVTERVRPDRHQRRPARAPGPAGAELLVATLDGLEDGAVQGVPQPADGISLAPKITPDDARVDWTAPAVRVDRLVRACTPAPGAWTTLRGKRVKLGPVTPAGLCSSRGRSPPTDWWARATSAVRLGQVQPEGKGPMPAADWVRGLRLEPGERMA
jgi:methionyl-tRNA formyltransferase